MKGKEANRMSDIQRYKQEMLQLKKWAVIGATPTKEKFGFKIYRTLQEHQYQVFGVNPRYKELEGEIVYPDLKSLPESPDCISVVVPPKITMELLEEVHHESISYVWLQPGTYDAEVLKKAQELELKLVYNDCVLVTLGH